MSEEEKIPGQTVCEHQWTYLGPVYGKIANAYLCQKCHKIEEGLKGERIELPDGDTIIEDEPGHWGIYSKRGMAKASQQFIDNMRAYMLERAGPIFKMLIQKPGSPRADIEQCGASQEAQK